MARGKKKDPYAVKMDMKYKGYVQIPLPADFEQSLAEVTPQAVIDLITFFCEENYTVKVEDYGNGVQATIFSKTDSENKDAGYGVSCVAPNPIGAIFGLYKKWQAADGDLGTKAVQNPYGEVKYR